MDWSALQVSLLLAALTTLVLLPLGLALARWLATKPKLLQRKLKTKHTKKPQHTRKKLSLAWRTSSPPCLATSTPKCCKTSL